jgi:hypothetical protein
MKMFFCDCCKKEIGRNYVSERLNEEVKINGVLVMIEITIGMNKCWNQGDLCKDCLQKACETAIVFSGGKSC